MIPVLYFIFSQSQCVRRCSGCITPGHPCCVISNCQEPLISSRDRYCQTHRNENQVCAIIGCAEPAVAGFKTCKEPLHCTIEETHNVRGQARFQLKERLRRARVAHPVDGSVQQDIDLSALAADDSDDIFEVDANNAVLASPGTALDESQPQVKQRLRAQFGRKRTHNEQVLVAPCGVILGRTTFFNAEAISTCVVCSKPLFFCAQYLLVPFHGRIHHRWSAEVLNHSWICPIGSSCIVDPSPCPKHGT